MDGGLKDNEVTEVAVMACRSSLSFAETTFTVEVIPLIAIKKSSWTFELSIYEIITASKIVTSDLKKE